MKNDELQHFQKLAPEFKSYREASPLISLIEVEAMISGRASLHKQSTYSPLKRITMIATGSLLAALSYFAFLSPNVQAPTRGVGIPQTIQAPPASLAAIGDTIIATSKPRASKPITRAFSPISNTSPSKDEESNASLFTYLELPSDEIGKIGIYPEGSLVTYFYRRSDTQIGCLGLLRTWGAVIKDRPLPEGVSAPEIRPTFVTNGIGQKRMFNYNGNIDSVESERMFREINSLVPILVREDDATGPLTSRDLIFWYLPTDEFLMLLSDSMRTIAIAQTTQTGSGVNVTNAAAKATIQKAIAYPNPSTGNFSLRLELSESQNVIIALRDLLGREVAPQRNINANPQSTVRLDFDVPDGLYLLDITPQHGDRVIQRIVIERK